MDAVAAWIRTHGSTLATVTLVLGLLQNALQANGTLLGPTWTPIALYVGAGVIKLIQSVTGTTSNSTPPPSAQPKP